MRKSLWIILTAVFVAIGAPNAHADTFAATFTCAGTCVSLPTAPALVSFPSPTTISESWDGFSFSFLLSAPDAPTDSYTWANAILPSLFPFPLITAGIVDHTTGDIIIINPPGETILTTDGGALTFAPVATPEPSSVALMLAGIGFLLVMGKRLAQGLPQAT